VSYANPDVSPNSADNGLTNFIPFVPNDCPPLLQDVSNKTIVTICIIAMLLKWVEPVLFIPQINTIYSNLTYIIGCIKMFSEYNLLVVKLYNSD